ncbi:preprotein translocase subunit SecG [Candidatus Gracilibacteria bacterium 28_42_T64]|nr:preprotein translocase subunit SecG [Candidatus Gracilibacteria bacterium 28_42_T64]
MLEILKFIEVIVAVLLVFIVLIQNKNVSLNLSSMSGGMGEVTKRGPEKILHNATIILGVIFIANSLALFWLS